MSLSWPCHWLARHTALMSLCLVFGLILPGLCLFVPVSPLSRALSLFLSPCIPPSLSLSPLSLPVSVSLFMMWGAVGKHLCRVGLAWPLNRPLTWPPTLVQSLGWEQTATWELCDSPSEADSSGLSVCPCEQIRGDTVSCQCLPKVATVDPGAVALGAELL